MTLSRLTQPPVSDGQTSRRNSAEVMKRLFDEAFAIENEDARRAGTIGYMGRVLVQATLPYREPRDSPPAWGRRNGNVSLVIQPGYTIRDEQVLDHRSGRMVSQQVPHSIGYPYGNIPRLVLAWLSTEAVRTQSRQITLGHSLREFMESIGLDSMTGGKNGSITRLREQMGRLFASTIAVVRDEQNAQGMQSLQTAGFRLTDQASVWWDAQRPEQAGLFKSELTLSERFFEELTQKPVPIDLRALRALKQSPIALDIYSWLTWRNSFLRANTTVPWEALMGQFGTESSSKKFRENFKKALQQVLVVYPAARVDVSSSGLILIPSPTSIPKVIAMPKYPK